MNDSKSSQYDFLRRCAPIKRHLADMQERYYPWYMSFRYLKDDVYYNDLYDRFTVEHGRRIEERHAKEEKLTPQEQPVAKMVDELYMYHFKGGRYKNKASTIQSWKTEAKRQDDLLENATPPENIHCLSCNTLMECTDRDLMDQNGKEDILFMYDCPRCKKHRAFFSDSHEFRHEKPSCEKCRSKNVKETVENKKKLIISTTCLDCKHVRTMEIGADEKPPDPNYITDRDRFCLNDKEGKEYVDDFLRMEGLTRLMKEVDERDKARAEKLKEHPEGLHLFDGEGYSCPICGTSMTGVNTWFDQYGQKCIRCKRNIDDGVIPPDLCQYEKRDVWMTQHKVQDITGLHPATIRKHVRHGELKPRSLKDDDGSIYYELFMVEENIEFLKKYAKPKGKTP